MRFFRWVIKKYEHDETIKGNVARSFKADKPSFPSYRCPKTQRRYLVQCCGASDNFLKAFDELVEEYERKGHRTEISQ